MKSGRLSALPGRAPTRAAFRAGAAVCVFAGVVLAVSLPENVAATQSNLGPATEVTAPSNAGSNPFAFLSGVSCASVGSCVGVGGHVDTSSPRQAMEATVTDGTFGPAQRGDRSVHSWLRRYANGGLAALRPTTVLEARDLSAPDGAAHRDQGGRAATGAPALGTTLDPHPARQRRVQSGPWTLVHLSHPGPSPPLRTDAPQALALGLQALPGANLSGVSCSSAGSCVAVGNYTRHLQSYPGDRGGRDRRDLRQASEVTAPSNAASVPVAEVSRGVVHLSGQLPRRRQLRRPLRSCRRPWSRPRAAGPSRQASEGPSIGAPERSSSACRALRLAIASPSAPTATAQVMDEAMATTSTALPTTTALGFLA